MSQKTKVLRKSQNNTGEGKLFPCHFRTKNVDNKLMKKNLGDIFEFYAVGIENDEMDDKKEQSLSCNDYITACLIMHRMGDFTELQYLLSAHKKYFLMNGRNSSSSKKVL